MKHPHGVVAHWKGGWDEPGLCRWVEELRSRLDAPGVTLGLLFTTPQFFDRASLYQENGLDYPDNPQRFIFFSK